MGQSDRHEFRPLLAEIEDRPLSPLGQSVFWILMAAILFFGLWLTLGQVDVVVTARGRVIPAGEVKTVQPLTTGVVRSIRVQPGELVDEGQLLMEIDPSDIDPELMSLRSEAQQVELALLRLNALLAGSEFVPAASDYAEDLKRVQVDLYHTARARLDSQLRVKRQEARQVEERLAAQQQSYVLARERAEYAERRRERIETVGDLLSRDELEQARHEAQEAKTAWNNALHTKEELQAGLERIARETALLKDEERGRLLSELAENRQRQAYLAGRIEQAEFRSGRQRIVAPVRGHVTHLQVHTVGGVVTPAENLAFIVPLDSPLVIKALVANRDVGYIVTGMPVSLKIDTFEFQKYGLLQGELLQVSRDSIEDERMGLMYEILVRPEQTRLQVQGREAFIETGMGVTAEIRIGKRRIIEFFLYPLIRYLDEGISVR